MPAQLFDTGMQFGAPEALLSMTAPHKANRSHMCSHNLEVSLTIYFFNADNWQNCACDCTCTASFLAEGRIGDRLHFPGACCAGVSCVTAQGPCSSAGGTWAAAVPGAGAGEPWPSAIRLLNDAEQSWARVCFCSRPSQGGWWALFHVRC